MDANSVIPLFVVLFCGIRLIRTLNTRNRKDIRGWIIILSFVILIAALGYFMFRDSAALLAGAALVLFVVLPSYCVSIANRWLDRGYYQAAYVLSLLAYGLHPLDDWDAGPVIARVLLIASRGRVVAALAELDRYRIPTIRGIAYAKVETFRINGQWEALRTFLENNINRFEDPYFINFYIRAFGETGDPNGMLTAYRTYRDSLKSIPYLDRLLLFLYAFCGQKPQTERIAQAVFNKSQKEFVTLWEATAALAVGDKTVIPHIRDLASSSDFKMRAIAKRRLSFPLPCAQDILTPESREILELVDTDLINTQKLQQSVRSDTVRPYVTYVLITINCVVFALEVLSGGSEDFGALIQMGALMPFFVLFRNEWWRLLTSIFLHYGLLHLALNMLGLYRLGPFVERILGTVRYAIFYFLAGLVPGLLMILLAHYHLIESNIVAVGASGAIMGILGAEAAILLRAWRSTRSATLRSHLTWIVLIIGIQAIFDLAVLTAGSMFVHLCGTLVGFILALLSRHRASQFTMVKG